MSKEMGSFSIPKSTEIIDQMRFFLEGSKSGDLKFNTFFDCVKYYDLQEECIRLAENDDLNALNVASKRFMEQSNDIEKRRNETPGYSDTYDNISRLYVNLGMAVLMEELDIHDKSDPNFSSDTPSRVQTIIVKLKHDVWYQ